MSCNKSVIVLAPNGRRQTVKVNPNTTILQILEEVCRKQGFLPEEYDIKHHNHVLDTTSIIRFSGLPNNAQLEMTKIRKTREESEVTLVLQLESGSRLTGSFVPANSLWDVMKKLCPDEADTSTNLVVIYMRQEVYGKENLKMTTLRNLGLTGGRAMLRILHRTPEELHHQANVSGVLSHRSVNPPDNPVCKENPISEASPGHSYQSTVQHSESRPMRASSESDSGKQKDSKNQDTTGKFAVSQEKLVKDSEVKRKGSSEVQKDLTESMEVDFSGVSIQPSSKAACEPTIQEEETYKENVDEPIFLLGERNAVVFSLSMAKAVSYEDLPDDFFDVTVDDVRSLLQDLRRQRAELEDSPLATRALKELEESKRKLNQLNQYRKTVLRIQFPDRTVLQGTFTPVETVGTVIEFVRGFLEDPSLSFHLYTTPPKTILSPETRLVDANCVPCALIHFGTEEERSSRSDATYLRKNVLTQFTSPKAAALAACQSRGIVPGSQMPKTPVMQVPPVYSESKAGHSSQSVNKEVAGNQPIARHHECQPEGGPSNKVPKWFKQ